MHVAYKNIHSTSSSDKAYFFKEQGSNILHNKHQSIIGNNDNDNMATENSLDSISDISMDDDVTYMDYSLNNFDPTDDIPNSDDDVIMELYVF